MENEKTIDKLDEISEELIDISTKICELKKRFEFIVMECDSKISYGDWSFYKGTLRDFDFFESRHVFLVERINFIKKILES